MNILVIGQCSLHWARMEFGNIGNYYIIEPLMRELHRVFPGAEIKTTMQLTDRFCNDENVTVIPMDTYYGWTDQDLRLAKKEVYIAEVYSKTREIKETTPYIEEVLAADLVIDFSGDIWGDNANFLGQDRFEVGLLKNKIAQLMGKKTIMLAGSPGPFSNNKTKKLAQEVYEKFDLVTNREAISTRLLEAEGFNVSNTESLACPAFLFEPAKGAEVEDLIKEEGLSKLQNTKPLVGFILCGWNFEQGPFDKSHRSDDEFENFAKSIEYLTENLGARVCLLSHANGFDTPPEPFRLKHGRDYTIIKQLEKVLLDRGISKDFFVLNGVYDAWKTKAIIKCFDMLVSGRIHASVAGISQNIPTVIIDYGHEPKAHKLLGFAQVAQVQNYVANPCSSQDLNKKIKECWENRKAYMHHLSLRIPEVKALAKKNFDLIKEVIK